MTSRIVILLACISLGFSFQNPAENNKKKSTKKNNTSRSSSLQKQTLRAQNAQNLTPVEEGQVVTPAVKTQKKSDDAQSKKSFSSQNAKTPLDIQSQLDQIVRVNQTLKTQYLNQASEIQRISEQARIHQRILQGLEARKLDIPKPAPTAVPILPNTRSQTVSISSQPPVNPDKSHPQMP